MIEEVKFFDNECDTLEIGNYILVKFTGKKSVKHYVGRIIDLPDENEIETKFMRRSSLQKYGSLAFIYPAKDEIYIYS